MADRHRRQPPLYNRLVVGIAGPTSSGKTTLSKLLLLVFGNGGAIPGSGFTSVTLHQDDYLVPNNLPGGPQVEWVDCYLEEYLGDVMVSRACLDRGFTLDAARNITPAEHQQIIRDYRNAHPRTWDSPRCDTEALVLQKRIGKHRDMRLAINNLVLDVDIMRARNSILDEDRGLVTKNQNEDFGVFEETSGFAAPKMSAFDDPDVPNNILRFGNPEVQEKRSGFADPEVPVKKNPRLADPKAPVKKLRFADPEFEVKTISGFGDPEVPGAPRKRQPFTYPEVEANETSRFGNQEVETKKSRFAGPEAEVKKDKKAKKVDLVDPDSRVRKRSLRPRTEGGTVDSRPKTEVRTVDVRPKTQVRTVNVRPRTQVRIVDVRKPVKDGESTKGKASIANEEPPKKEEPAWKYVPTNGELPMEERVHHGLPPFFSDPTMPVDMFNKGRPGYIIDPKPNSLPPHHSFHTPINTAQYPDIRDDTNVLNAIRLRSRVHHWIKYITKLNDDVGFPGMNFKMGKLRGLVFVEGFMILDPVNGVGPDDVPRTFDITMFLSATREGTRKRRLERPEYNKPLKEDHMTWREASYFDGVVWPAFVAEHRWIFDMTPEQANEGLMPSFNFGNVSDLARMQSMAIRPGEMGVEMTLLWAVNAMLYQFGKKEKFARDRWVEAMNMDVGPVVRESVVDEDDLKMMFEMEKKNLGTKDRVALLSREFSEVVRDGEVEEVDEIAQVAQVAEVDDLVGIVNLAGLAEFDEVLDLVDLDKFGEVDWDENIDPQLFSLGDANGENEGADPLWDMQDNNLVGEPLFEDGFFSGGPFFFDDEEFIDNVLSGAVDLNEGLVEYQDYSAELRLSGS